MNQDFVSMKEEFEEERQFYTEELSEQDGQFLKEAGELYLIHAYEHLFNIPESGYEVLGDFQYNLKYSQFHLNLEIGLELLLKAILLKKGQNINAKSKNANTRNPSKTIPLSIITDDYLNIILPNINKTTFDEIKYTLKLINLKRNNIAHSSKRTRDSYLYENRFSYITLYIYELYFYGHNKELTDLLLKSIRRSEIPKDYTQLIPLEIRPASLNI